MESEQSLPLAQPALLTLITGHEQQEPDHFFLQSDNQTGCLSLQC